MEKKKSFDEKMQENDEKKRKEDEILKVQEQKKEREYQQRVMKAKNIASVYKNQKDMEEKNQALVSKVFFLERYFFFFKC